MTPDSKDAPPPITPSMTILDVLVRNRATEAVFKAYDERAGVCLCCQALFDRLDTVAEQYHLDLATLLADLEAVD